MAYISTQGRAAEAALNVTGRKHKTAFKLATEKAAINAPLANVESIDAAMQQQRLAALTRLDVLPDECYDMLDEAAIKERDAMLRAEEEREAKKKAKLRMPAFGVP